MPMNSENVLNLLKTDEERSPAFDVADLMKTSIVDYLSKVMILCTIKKIITETMVLEFNDFIQDEYPLWEFCREYKQRAFAFRCSGKNKKDLLGLFKVNVSEK